MPRGRWILAAIGLAAAVGFFALRPHDPRPNVVVVTIDTLRADRVSAFGGPPGLTPHLDRLAAGAARFTQAYTTAPLTLPAHVSMFSGALPAAHTVRTNDGRAVPSDLPLVAERFQSAGYRTGGFVGAYVLRRDTGIARGFAHFDDALDARAERRAGEVVDAALAWIGEGDDTPFFVWVHLFDPHLDYDPPEPFRTMFADRPYDGEVAYADAEVGRLLAAIEGWRRRDTAVIVLADHGEGLGDHGEATHGALLFDATTRVPLIVKPAVEGSARTVDHPVTTAGVAPTALALASLDPAGFGTPLIDAAGAVPDPEAVVMETTYLRQLLGWSPLYALRRDTLKIVYGPRAALFDLGNDPGERTNRAASDAASVEQLRATLTRELSAAASAGAARVTRSSSGDRDMLASLGYVSGGPSATGFEPPAGTDPGERMEVWGATERALELAQKQRPEEAERAFAGVLASDPGNALALKFLGARALERGELDRAIALHEPLVSRGLHLADAHANLALAYLRAGRTADALAAADRALAIDPAHRGATANRALIVASQSAAPGLDALARRLDAGDVAGVRAALEERLRSNPDDADALVMLGNALARSGEIGGARAAFERAVRLRPGDASAVERLAAVLHQSGDTRAARQLFERALVLDASARGPQLGLAVIDLEEGRPGDALARLDRMAGQGAGAAEAQCFRGFALADLGRTLDARAALRQCADTLPAQSPLAAQARGRLETLAASHRRK